MACPLPLALLIDEIDTLQGVALISVLRQLRSGFSYKAQAFPDSVALCGMRDLKDYRIAARQPGTRRKHVVPCGIAWTRRVEVTHVTHSSPKACSAR